MLQFLKIMRHEWVLKTKYLYSASTLGSVGQLGIHLWYREHFLSKLVSNSKLEVNSTNLHPRGKEEAGRDEEVSVWLLCTSRLLAFLLHQNSDAWKKIKDFETKGPTEKAKYRSRPWTGKKSQLLWRNTILNNAMNTYCKHFWHFWSKKLSIQEPKW